jgi:hypothetical protein
VVVDKKEKKDEREKPSGAERKKRAVLRLRPGMAELAKKIREEAAAFDRYNQPEESDEEEDEDGEMEDVGMEDECGGGVGGAGFGGGRGGGGGGNGGADAIAA